MSRGASQYAADDALSLCGCRGVEKTMKHKLLSGVLLAVAATVVVPNVWAAQPQALASDGSDHVGAGAVASDGADHVGAGAVASDGADHVGAGAVASDGADHVGAGAVASDGADHVGAGAVASDGADHVGAGALASDGADRTGVNRVAYSRVGVGSDRVASALMTGSYSDQFNSPQ